MLGYIITNPALQDGAVAATYPGVRETLTGMLGDDVYIIPSSVQIEQSDLVKKGVRGHGEE
ncbi:hypothetical protein [uncultured Phocaeicola sp.]|uniref:hypothetical protein n=1 Tax=uncultured Phocaeicola sp. TaxID=990718 RepID=UPI0026149293|nr:hypothetical protein [uncultured Phocaeicola sp.]